MDSLLSDGALSPGRLRPLCLHVRQVPLMHPGERCLIKSDRKFDAREGTTVRLAFRTLASCRVISPFSVATQVSHSELLFSRCCSSRGGAQRRTRSPAAYQLDPAPGCCWSVALTVGSHGLVLAAIARSSLAAYITLQRRLGGL